MDGRHNPCNRYTESCVFSALVRELPYAVLTALLPYGELLWKTSFDLSVVVLDYTRALLPKNKYQSEE